MAKRKVPLIRVFANPFGCEADHEDRLHCHVHYEPSGNNDAGMNFVGCKLVATQTVFAMPNQVLGVVGPHDVTDFDHVWVYDTEPSVVPLTAYYMQHLRQHGHHGAALIPADKESWKLVFGDDKSFIDPKRKLAQLHIERGHAPTMKGFVAPEPNADGSEPEVQHHVAHFRAWLDKDGGHHTAAVAHDEARKNAKMTPVSVPQDKPTTPDSPQALHASPEPHQEG